MEDPFGSKPDPSVAPHDAPRAEARDANWDFTGSSRTPLELAFEIGRLLNQLDWSIAQAIIAADKKNEDDAFTIFTRLELILVALYPHDRGGELRRTVESMQKTWGYIGNESFADDWDAGYEFAREFPEPEFERVFLDMRSMQVPDHARKLSEAISKRFRPYPRMRAALNLGKCIDEGLRVPAVREHLIVRVKPSDRPATLPAKYLLDAVAKGPGEIPPADSWYEEVTCLWSVAGVRTELPAIQPEEHRSISARLRFNQRLVDAALQGLSAIPNQIWKNDLESKDWPPNEGWHFRDGEFAIGGETFRLVGKEVELLKILAKAWRPATADDLFRSVWPEESGESAGGKVRTLLTNLRKTLRRFLKLPNRADPIPSVGRSKGWKLDMDVILNSIKERKNRSEGIPRVDSA